MSELSEMVDGLKGGDLKKVAFNAGILAYTAYPSSSKDGGFFGGKQLVKVLAVQTAKQALKNAYDDPE